MGDSLDIDDNVGLRFLTEMSVAISHELKNAVAIIGQNAGLLEDLILMADQGTPIDRKKLKRLLERVVRQIKRAEGIAENMNRFAHSVEDSAKCINVGETLEFVVSLCSRVARLRGVTLETKPLESSVAVTATPFALKALIWLCLKFAIDVVGDGGNIVLVAEKAGSGAQIKFARLKILDKALMGKFPTEREKALLTALGAGLAIEVGSTEFVLTLPGNIGQ